MTRTRAVLLLPFGIIWAGFALRLFHLGAESLWYDETVSILLARSDLPELIRHTAGDIHPPFYYILLHFWGLLAGWSEWSVAFLSLIFGVLLIALVYRLARAWLGARVALLAAFLVAISPYNVWYSQEVRMYTLGAFLGLASVHFLLRLLRSSALTAALLAYVLVTALGLYTLYYFLFLIVFEYVVAVTWTLSQLQSRGPQRFGPAVVRVSGPFLFSQLLLALAYLPWLPIALRQATDPPVPPWRTFVGLPAMLIESFSALVAGQSLEPAAVAPVLLGVAALLAYALLRPQRLAVEGRPLSGATGRMPGSLDARLAALFLLGYTFLPLLAIYVLSLWRPLYHVRYIFTYSPAFYVLLALAVTRAAGDLARTSESRRLALSAAALGLMALASIYSLYNFWYDPRYAADDLRGAVGRLAEQWRPGDAILLNAGYTYPALLYYYDGPIAERVRLTDYRPAAGDAQQAPVVLLAGSIGGSPRLGWNDPLSDFYPTTADATRAALDRVFRSHPRVWLLRLYDTVTDPDGVIRRYFAERAQLIDEVTASGESNARTQGYLTGRVASLPAGAAPLDADLAGRVTLLGFESSQPPRRAGDFYDAVLYWQPTLGLNYNYQLSLQLLDGRGQVIAQQDETPLGSALPTSRWRSNEIYREPVRLKLQTSLLAGHFTIIVKLYNLNGGEVLGAPVTLQAFDVPAR